MTSLKTTARLTGLAYLGLAGCGAVGFLLVRRQLYVPGDAVATAANLVAHEGLARLGVAADLGVVLTQAVAALGFFRLFRPVDRLAAGAIAAFGLVNAVVVLVATMFSATALEVALAARGTSAGDALLLYDLNAAGWRLGGLFFGLWLIPMGRAVRRSGHGSSALAVLLVAGGVGYLLSTFLGTLAPAASGLADALVLPATIGEFWMIGRLIVARGPSVEQSARRATADAPS